MFLCPIFGLVCVSQKADSAPELRPGPVCRRERQESFAALRQRGTEAAGSSDLSYFCPVDRSAKCSICNPTERNFAVVCFDAFDSTAKMKADVNQSK